MNVVHIIGTIIIGFLAGVVAKLIIPAVTPAVHRNDAAGNRRRFRRNLPRPGHRLVSRR